MLEVRGVSKRFGDIVALDHLDLTVPDGVVVGFLGPNGAGKTTVMRVVMGIVEPDEGEVVWQSHPVAHLDRVSFGYMPEERGLYPGMVVREQLAYLGRLHGLDRAAAVREADQWLERLGIADRGNDKLETLSLGNQQRVQLASALVFGPALLVLDEPFSGLDPVGVDDLGEVLAEQAASGVGVLFSSHQLDLVEHVCQSVVIVDDGNVVVTGTVDELTRSRDVLVVEVEGDPRGAWAKRVKGARVSENQGGRLRLLLEDADPDAVLDAARAAGSVLHFGFERRHLSEIFREAVR